MSPETRRQTMQTIRKTCNVAGKQMLLNKQTTDFFCSGSNVFEMKSSNGVVYRKMTSMYNRLQNCTVLLIYDALAIFFILLVCSPLHWVLCPMGSCLKMETDHPSKKKHSLAILQQAASIPADKRGKNEQQQGV